MAIRPPSRGYLHAISDADSAMADLLDFRFGGEGEAARAVVEMASEPRW